ncbi:hypothetical protein FPRO06_12172 [Fusarium proliferatum]|nr:hypothetical protein FPRO03_13486 [Fusarium proliferatum]KAG4269223.1 hypothetical protein FPRO04_12098 [Fusarium proliferatum]KAG4292684.1 hypothetical protein FPRO06_12172 [Fusarium proliferatum]CVL06986.1 uncharacterized protein FPRN_13911 [Fusarium proliferatum]
MNNPIGSASRPITEFEYDAEDIPRIIQTIGYSRFSAQYLPGAIHRPIAYPPDVLDSLRPFPESNSGPRPRGVFDRDRLLISRVLPWCDVQSLFNLRQTNFRLRKIISRHIIYRHIIKALPLYHAILNTRYAQRVLAIDFWILLTTKSCDICGEFAMLISIPEWLRLCQYCVELGGRLGAGLDLTLKVSRFVRLSTFSAEWLAPGKVLPPRFWHRDFGVGLKG